MVEIQHLEEGVLSVPGFRATGVSCGLKTGGSKDISLLLSERPCSTAMAFTKNKIQGAHITVNKEISHKNCQAILINGGNANCLTGQTGIDHAREIVSHTAELLKLPAKSCLLASTGAIGVPLNMTRVLYGIERLVNVIPNESNLRNFCSGMSSSDARHKNIAYRFKMGGETVTIGVSAKGESMIKPWLETMQGTLLVVAATDANITQSLLRKTVAKCIDTSFNRISVDNDMSPNDTVFVLANGLSSETPIKTEADPRYEVFLHVMKKIMLDMSKQLLKQGLGTTRLLHITAKNASSEETAEKIIRAVAESFQVKAGFFAQKIPWQKILNVLSAHDYDFDIDKVKLSINGNMLFENGQPDISKIAGISMDPNAAECNVVIDLQAGTAERDIWSCDLTHDYLKFNSLLADQY